MGYSKDKIEPAKVVNYIKLKPIYEKSDSIASQFIDDIVLPEGTLYAKVFDSTIAHGNILSVDIEEAKKIPGVKGIYTHNDIPGINQVGGIIQDETLFAEKDVQFMGEPIEYEKLPVIIDPREAFEKNRLIIPPKTFSFGDTEKAWKDCDVIVEGKVESGGQEHLYLETQSAIAIPEEGGKIRINA